MKFERGRHGQNLLTKAPPSGGYPKYLQIWDKQKSTFLTHFFNFGHEGVPIVTPNPFDEYYGKIELGKKIVKFGAPGTEI